MGNCRSSHSTSQSHGTGKNEDGKKDGTRTKKPAGGLSSTNTEDDVSVNADDVLRDSTSAVMSAFLPSVLKSAREALSKRLIEERRILLDENLVTAYGGIDSGNVPFKPISVDVGSVRAVGPEALRNDMERMPDFEWPEKDRFEELMEKQPEGGAGMVVLDLSDVDIKISLDRGIEVTLPAKGPMGTSGDLEVGAGGGIDEAWFEMKEVELRLWVVNKTGRIYVAFMDTPNAVVPYFHVNFDKGRGDFMGQVYKKGGSSFDEALVGVLSHFGPGKGEKTKKGKAKKAWKGDVMRSIWKSAAENLKPEGGRRVPLEVGMSLGSSESKGSVSGEDTVALIESFLPIVLPIVRTVLSKQLIDRGLILRDEEPVTDFADAQMNAGLPISPLGVKVGKMAIVQEGTLRNDMKSMPNFEWPEKERVEELMKRQSEGGAGMIVLDLADVDVDIYFDRGVELVFPVEGPMGMKADLEVGAGGSIETAGFQLRNLKVRVWFVTETAKLYVAFMDRPDIIPRIHVNVDRGRGDFMNQEYTETGTMIDDVIERVLLGFGPKCHFNAKTSQTNRFGNSVGAMLSSAIGTFAHVGNGRPLELELQEQIQSAIDIAMGEPRSVEAIEANIELLKEELEASKKRKKLETTDKTQERNHDPEPVVQSFNETDTSNSWVCGALSCLG